MSETKTLHKWFWVWEFEKEERWLNEMAQEGWALTCGGFCTYTFEKCEPGEYIIRVEALDNSSDFECNVTSFACTEISSVLVLNTKPVIPMISPISYVLNAL